MDIINRPLHRTLTWLSITIFTLLIVDVVLGVTSRYLFGGQIRWTEELATFLLVWQVFSGAAIAYHDKAHLGIDLLVQNLDTGAKRIAILFAHLLVLAFAIGVMVWGGTLLTLERFDAGQMMSTLGVPKALLYLSVPLNGVFISMFNIGFITETISSFSKEGRVEA